MENALSVPIHRTGADTHFVGNFDVGEVAGLNTPAMNPFDKIKIDNRGKIKVTVKDAGMQPVNGVEVYLFVNESLAGSVAAGAPKGFFKKETTDENGIAFFYDLAPNTY